ncbi:MAG: nitrite reductase, copper-containing, partial [Chloroflexi bacterium]|nr:nitrite reductase, copper-containing [Chloroflexota bacterium]
MKLRPCILYFLILVFAVSACSPKANAPKDAGMSGQTTEAAREFTLITAEADGRMVYIGQGGYIDGLVNPDLQVQPGESIRLIMINGDGILHDVALPDLKVGSEAISKKDDRTEVVFTAPEAGEFVYFCTLPGHRQAGMEGRLIVKGTELAQNTVSPAEDQPLSLVSVALAPDDLPPALDRREPQVVRVELETVEVDARLADGSSYRFWTFNGTVPGPFIRVRVGDTLEVVLKNAEDSQFAHSVDFHAATG